MNLYGFTFSDKSLVFIFFNLGNFIVFNLKRISFRSVSNTIHIGSGIEGNKIL